MAWRWMLLRHWASPERSEGMRCRKDRAGVVEFGQAAVMRCPGQQEQSLDREIKPELGSTFRCRNAGRAGVCGQ